MQNSSHASLEGFTPIQALRCSYSHLKLLINETKCPVTSLQVETLALVDEISFCSVGFSNRCKLLCVCRHQDMNRREQRGCCHCEDCSVLQDYVLSAAHDNTVQSVLVGGSHKCPCKGSSQTNPPPTQSIIPVPAIVHKKRIIPELSAVLNEDGAPCPAHTAFHINSHAKTHLRQGPKHANTERCSLAHV